MTGRLDHVDLTRSAIADRVRWVAELTLKGLSARQIAVIYGLSSRSIVRYRTRARREGLL